MQEAMRFLGHPHCLSGEVVHGRQLGRTIGVPTANLLIPEGVLTPAFGVYATRVALPDGTEKRDHSLLRAKEPKMPLINAEKPVA